MKWEPGEGDEWHPSMQGRPQESIPEETASPTKQWEADRGAPP